MERLRKRREFLAVAKGRRINRAAFVMQARSAPADREGQPPRFGFTVTRKLGGAVVRNRIRRRLKEAVRIAAAQARLPAVDIVLVGRPEALTQPFTRLLADVADGLAAVRKGLSRATPEPAAAPASRAESADAEPAEHAHG